MNLEFTLVNNAIDRIIKYPTVKPIDFMYQPELFKLYQVKNLRKVMRDKFQCPVHNICPRTWSPYYQNTQNWPACCVPKALIGFSIKGIWVNPKLSPSTQYFCLIHELLHWVFDHDCVSRSRTFDELDVGICQYLIYTKLGFINQAIDRISYTIILYNCGTSPLLHSDMKLYAINNSINLLEVANTVYQNIKT